MKNRMITLALISIFIALLAVACGSAATPAPTAVPTEHPGQALVSSRCTTCHPITIVQNAEYDKEGWDFTVGRMVAMGASLDDTQKASVVDYLAIAYTYQK